MSTISVKNFRGVFSLKNGLPKKEILLNKTEVYKKAKIKLSNKDIERKYQDCLFHTAMSNLNKSYRKHHCNFLRVLINDVLHYGFSSDYDLIQENEQRYKKRKEIAIRTHRKVKKITEQQIQGLLPFEENHNG